MQHFHHCDRGNLHYEARHEKSEIRDADDDKAASSVIASDALISNYTRLLKKKKIMEMDGRKV